MQTLIRVIGLVGILDGLLILIRPRGWARLWMRLIPAIGDRAGLARALGVLELVVAGFLIARASGRAATAAEDESLVARTSSRRFVPWSAPPSLQWIFRLPVVLYRLNLGWLFGHRFLLLTHRGRRSGKEYQSMLEVVHYNPDAQESIVLSGWGTQADWYKNIKTHAPLEVQTNRERYVPYFRELSPDEAYPVLMNYVRNNPRLARPFVRWLFQRWGFEFSSDPEVQRAQARALLMIAFWPRVMLDPPTGQEAQPS